MADNVPITAGSGTNIAADDVSSVFYQRMKLVDGTDGSTTASEIDSGNALGVRARFDTQQISVQSGGLTTSVTAYSTGDQVGTQFTMANAARASGGTGRIVGVQLISAADIIGAYDVVVFDSSVTLASDNSAFAISDADALKVIGLIPLAGAYDIGNNRIAQNFDVRMPYICSGSTSLFAGLIARAGHTFFGAATDLQLIFYVERD